MFSKPPRARVSPSLKEKEGIESAPEGRSTQKDGRTGGDPCGRSRKARPESAEQGTLGSDALVAVAFPTFQGINEAVDTVLEPLHAVLDAVEAVVVATHGLATGG